MPLGLVTGNSSNPLGLDRTQLASAISCATLREKLVLTLAYYEELTDAQIAAALNEDKERILEVRESGLRRIAAELGIEPA